MGFEEALPAEPTREQEIAYIQRQKEEMLSQPFFRFFMNESLRRRKMEDSKDQVAYKFRWLLNFILGSGITAALMTVPTRFFYRRDSNFVPYINNPKYITWTSQSPLQFRNLKRLKLFWIVTLGMGYSTASAFTDAKSIADPYNENKFVIVDSF